MEDLIAETPADDIEGVGIKLAASHTRGDVPIVMSVTPGFLLTTPLDVLAG
jgi:hypothetical protein